MNSFESMVSTLNNLETWSANSQKKTVSKLEYDVFCKEYMFDQLKGIGFGEAFCERFDIKDPLINIVSNDTAKIHIELLGYIE